ncbi:MAG: diaminopimelate decarboxylase [Firmicutes bacterium]|nr:diaminopimelate decarboxylase [Bacillota bacterium]
MSDGFRGCYKLNGEVTDRLGFYGDHDPVELVRRFGSPLYLYSEDILRANCRTLKNMCTYKNFRVNFSVKANTNLAIIRIAREEGLCADAMSPGEIAAVMAAGYEAPEILFIPNNVSGEEMRFAAEKGIMISVDSLSQLDLFGRLFPGKSVAVRLNPGIGAGHHEKVVTAGDAAKFGVNLAELPEIKEILRRRGLRLAGLSQHIGSKFMDSGAYIMDIRNLLAAAEEFPGLDFIDFGGGFGIPYRKQENEPPMDMGRTGVLLDAIMSDFAARYGKEVQFIVEPGRYVAAEAGVLLGTVHAIKHNGSIKFIGTDIGMNTLMRPALYDSHHDIEVYSLNPPAGGPEAVSVVGNICESGDILAKDRPLPRISEGDVLGVLDAGSYGYSMSSNYNMRLRPAEVLLRSNGEAAVIRERDSLEDLLRNQRMIDI